jgi:hypothetical protein
MNKLMYGILVSFVAVVMCVMFMNASRDLDVAAAKREARMVQCEQLMAQHEQRVSQCESNAAALKTTVATMLSVDSMLSTNLTLLTASHNGLIKATQTGMDRYAVEIILVEKALVDRFGESKWKASYEKAKADMAVKP